MTEEEREREETEGEQESTDEEARPERKPAPGHAEARILAFTTVYCQGAEWHLTMREGITGTSAAKFIEDLGAFTLWLQKKKAWSFSRRRVASSKRPATKEGGGSPQPPAPKSKKLTVEEATAPTTEGEETVIAKSISRHMTDDGERFFFRIYGGRYQKYGIRCWPEVAETLDDFGLELGDIELGDKYDIDGFNLVASFIRNEHGKVNKVVAFSHKQRGVNSDDR